MLRRLRRVGALLLATCAVGAALFGIDRLAFGPVPARGWQPATRLSALPRAITRPPAPPYVPPALAWPPAVLRYRLDARGRDDGLWLGLGARGAAAGAVALWIGRGPRAAAMAVGAQAADCLGGRCREGWRAQRVVVRRGPPLWIVGRVAAHELERVVSALSRAR